MKPASYRERQMFRSLYRQIAKFLNWVNRSGSRSSSSEAVSEAENHRRDVEDRAGGGWGS